MLPSLRASLTIHMQRHPHLQALPMARARSRALAQQNSKVNAAPGAPVGCQREQRLWAAPLPHLLVCAHHFAPCTWSCMPVQGSIKILC